MAARRGQAALAVEQPLLELAFIDFAIAAMPLALAVPLAFVELAGIPAAVGVVHAALTLQQTIDHIAPVAAAVGQARIGRQQRFAVSASGEQQGKGEGSEWAHSGIRIIERRVCRSCEFHT